MTTMTTMYKMATLECHHFVNAKDKFKVSSFCATRGQRVGILHIFEHRYLVTRFKSWSTGRLRVAKLDAVTNRKAREIGSELRYFSLSDCLIQLFGSWRFDRNLFAMWTHELRLTMKFVKRLPYANLHCLEN